MRYALAGLCVWFGSAIAMADEPIRPASDVEQAIERGVAFLTERCAGLEEHRQLRLVHHALVIWSLANPSIAASRSIGQSWRS